MAAIHVLLIEPDSSSAAFVRHMLSRAGYEVVYAPDGKQGLIAAWRDQPDVIVLELDLPDLDGLDIVHKLRADSRTARKRIICLTARSKPNETHAALSAGADDFIVKQVDAVDVLLRMLAEERAKEGGLGGTAPLKPGRLMAFISAKGGVGTSTLCVNLAHQMALTDEGRSTAVVDLVLPHGFLSRITGSESPVDIVHLTTGLGPKELTPDYLRINLPTPQPWSFRLVGGAGDPAQGARLDADRLAPVVQTLRSTFGRIIVDLGRTLSPLALLVLRQTDLIAVVLSQSVEVAASTKAVLAYLEFEGIPKERFYLLSNRPLGVEDVSLDDMEDILERKIEAAVPHLGPNLYLTTRLHAPLQLRFPQDSGTDYLQQVADKLLMRHQELAATTFS